MSTFSPCRAIAPEAQALVFAKLRSEESRMGLAILLDTFHPEIVELAEIADTLLLSFFSIKLGTGLAQ